MLLQSVGVKAEEMISYTQSHNLMVSLTVCMIGLCALEIGAYMLYNREVRISIYTSPFCFICDESTIIYSFILG